MIIYPKNQFATEYDLLMKALNDALKKQDKVTAAEIAKKIRLGLNSGKYKNNYGQIVKK